MRITGLKNILCKRWRPFSAYLRLFSNNQEKLKYSYSFMPGDTQLSHDTFSRLLDKTTNEVGDQIAFISYHQNIIKTYSQFHRDVYKLASGLVALGLCKGDRIGLCAPNLYEWPVVQFATAKAGLVMVNVNPAYQEEELKYCLNKVGCKAFITSETFKTQNFYDMLCSIMPELSTSNSGKIQSKNVPSLNTVILISNQAQKGTITYSDVQNLANSESDTLLEKFEKNCQFDDAVNIQFTSGTTGNPKGAVLTHHNMINNALFSGKRLGYFQEKPIVCCQVPLYHCFGCVLGSLGSVLFKHVCIFPSPSFNPEASLKCIEDKKCTTIYGTPTMFVDVINRYKPELYDISSLKQAVVGGAACPEDLLRKINSVLHIKQIHNAYGSTENSPAVAITDIDEDMSRVSAIKPLEYIELKVIDNEGKLLPVNTDGELCTRGHVLFLGYWNEKNKTDEVVDETKWYHTGDMAKMDEDGYIKIVDRIKDMVLRGGENIYPVEIENFLHKHPSVLEVHVIGVPDERLGEELCAWIKLEGSETLTEQDIKNFCKGKISHFKIPRYIMFRDDFPKTISGKIQKFKMREISIKNLKL